MKENLGSKEPLIANVDLEALLCDGIDAVKDLEPLAGVRIILGELLGNVRTNVAEHFLQAKVDSIQRKLDAYWSLCRPSCESYRAN